MTLFIMCSAPSPLNPDQSPFSLTRGRYLTRLGGRGLFKLSRKRNF